MHARTACEGRQDTYIHAVVPQLEYLAEAAQLKQELNRLQELLRGADARGDRRAALDILGRMLELQGAFFQRWKVSPGTAVQAQPGGNGRDRQQQPPSDDDDERTPPPTGRPRHHWPR